MTAKRSHILLVALLPILGSLISALVASLMAPGETWTLMLFLGMVPLMLFPWIILLIIGMVILLKKSLRASLIFYGASMAAMLLIMGGCFNLMRGG